MGPRQVTSVSSISADPRPKGPCDPRRVLLLIWLDLPAVPIAVLTLELRIEGAHSLKDKRQVLRSLKDKLRSNFNVSVAELEQTDLWQRATIGIVSISGSRDYLSGLMQQVERAATRIANDNGAEVTDSFVEME